MVRWRNTSKKRKYNTINLSPPPSDLHENDLISRLPPELIHNILQRLDSPSQAARTSILSRTWNRELWRSYPVVEYRRSKIHSPSKFRSFVASSSRRIREYFVPNGTPLSALRISLLGTPAHDQLVEQLLIESMTCGSPLEISIQIVGGRSDGCSLPGSAFRNCSRTKVLSLRGCRFWELGGTGSGSGSGSSFWAECFPNLESLSLRDEFLVYPYGLQGGDPDYLNFLESLSFPRGEQIQLTSLPLTLKNLELGGDIKLKAAAPNLKSVVFRCNGDVTQQDIDELISLLPSLESLSFKDSTFKCRNLVLKICSVQSKLRKFDLANVCSRFRPLEEIVIDAPKLDTFVYSHGRFSPLGNVNVVNVASDFRFVVVAHGLHGSKCFTYEWYVELRMFLQRVRSQLRHHLVLKCFPCSECICRQLMSRRCVKCSHANKCWRHRLKDVKIKSDTGETMLLSRSSGDSPLSRRRPLQAGEPPQSTKMGRSNNTSQDRKKRKKNTINLLSPPPLELQGDDLISKLPSEIIHNILQRLESTAEAARTSVLSKIWDLQFWRSYPVVEYRDSVKHSSSRFSSFVASSSRRMLGYFLHNRTPLSALRISLLDKPAEDQLKKLLFDSASRLAASCGSPLEISIEIGRERFTSYILHPSFFRNCSRTRVFRIRGCYLGDFGNSFWADNFPNLESLSLHYQNLLPVVGAGSITVIGADADYVDWLRTHSDYPQLRIQLTAVPLMLKNLELRGYIMLKAAAQNLKFLAFEDCEVSQQDLDELTSVLPSLESLSFQMSIFVSEELRLKISSPQSKLRELRLTDIQYPRRRPLEEIVIDAPKLATFVYGPPVGIVNVVKFASDCRFVVVSGMCENLFTYERYVKLGLFLERLRSQLPYNNLVVKLQGLQRHFKFRQIRSEVQLNKIASRDLVDVNHLELDVGSWKDSTFRRNKYLLDGCFSACRPRSMSVVQTGPGGRTQFFEYICRKLMIRRCVKCDHEDKCWRHRLKDVKIKSHEGKLMLLSRAVVSSMAEGEKTASTFVLTWEV
ncbi:hypothetical protein LINGRAHAP2_LOCUS9071 [Linum grandiflorum]